MLLYCSCWFSRIGHCVDDLQRALYVTMSLSTRFSWDLWWNGSLWESQTHITTIKFRFTFNPSRSLPFGGFLSFLLFSSCIFFSCLDFTFELKKFYFSFFYSFFFFAFYIAFIFWYTSKEKKHTTNSKMNFAYSMFSTFSIGIHWECQACWMDE